MVSANGFVLGLAGAKEPNSDSPPTNTGSGNNDITTKEGQQPPEQKEQQPQQPGQPGQPQQPQQPQQPEPITGGPDKSCLFHPEQEKCKSDNGKCPPGFNQNEDGKLLS